MLYTDGQICGVKFETVDAIRGREMQFALARSLANIEVDQSANA